MHCNIDPAFSVSGVPEELRNSNQWVCWRVETRDGKPTKAPVDPKNPSVHASSTNPATWGSFAQAVETAEAAGYGIGFVLDGFVGIDIDHGVKAGVPTPAAQRIVKHFNSYTEISPSGNGVHIFLVGEWGSTGRRTKLESGEGLEVYTTGRFFTITGRHVSGTPPTVEEREEELDVFNTEYFSQVSAEEPEATPVDATDAELLSAARSAKNGDKFKKLFDNGDTSEYGGDESAADFALLVLLAFWTGRDKQRMERLFTASALGKRDKWARSDYRSRSIASACRRAEETYKPSPEKPHNPVTVVMNNRAISDMATDGWSALTKANTPVRFFSREFSLVAFDADNSDVFRVTQVDADRLRFELRRVASWVFASTKRGQTTMRKQEPPVEVAKDMLANPHPPMPRLERVVEVPVFDHNGTLCARGYNPDSGLYYHDSNGFSVPDIPAEPTEDDVAHAKDIINDLLGEFPFVSESDRAHAIAFGLLPFARDLIAGPTPLHLFKKPSPGSGATLLVDVISRVATGRDQSGMTEAGNEEEWRKRLTSALSAMPTILLVDNLREPLDSGAVASALTASVWTDRVLGQTKTTSIPVRCVWVATANAPQLSNEMARRTIPIELDPCTDRPWLRAGFKHADLRSWTAKNRSELVWAFLLLVKNWLAAGRPEWSGRNLGSYEHWSSVIGGILELAGIEGFLDNLDAHYEASDVEGDPWRNFVQAWWEKFENRPVSVSVLFDAFWGMSGEGPLTLRSPSAVGLSKALTKNMNRVYTEFRVVRTTDQHTKSYRWNLEHIEGQGTKEVSDAA